MMNIVMLILYLCICIYSSTIDDWDFNGLDVDPYYVSEYSSYTYRFNFRKALPVDESRNCSYTNCVIEELLTISNSYCYCYGNISTETVTLFPDDSGINFTYISTTPGGSVTNGILSLYCGDNDAVQYSATYTGYTVHANITALQGCKKVNSTSCSGPDNDNTSGICTPCITNPVTGDCRAYCPDYYYWNESAAQCTLTACKFREPLNGNCLSEYDTDRCYVQPPSSKTRCLPGCPDGYSPVVEGVCIKVKPVNPASNTPKSKTNSAAVVFAVLGWVSVGVLVVVVAVLVVRWKCLGSGEGGSTRTTGGTGGSVSVSSVPGSKGGYGAM